MAICVGVLSMVTPGLAEDAKGSIDDRAKKFIEAHEGKVRPLEITVNRAWWTANVTGKDEDFKAKEEAQNRLDEALSDKKTFAQLKEIKEGKVQDPVLARQIEVLHLQYLEKQVDPELLKKMTAKSNAIEKTFNTTRAKVGDKEMTDSEVRKVLKESKKVDERKAVWEACKVVGARVEKELKELVKLRNEAAHKLGFKDYHQMQLFLAEQSQEDVLKLFDQLDELTRAPFQQIKAEID
ncbi:MAG: M2 family metallopeptidase, partial [Candidatus Riflebacteria bacterium]|nr:M2 family metallopeptidase [Candidatus Riflebacteria bacterium]